MPSDLPLRFVVLHHTGVPDPHFDLMLETTPGSPLATWRCRHWPIDRPGALVRLPDHRRQYLEYEGPVSGGRGEVRRVATGTIELTTCPRGDAGAVLLVLFSADGQLSRLCLVPEAGDRWKAEPMFA